MTSPKGNKQTETLSHDEKEAGPSIRPNHMLPETPLEKKDEKSKVSDTMNNSPVLDKFT